MASTVLSDSTSGGPADPLPDGVPNKGPRRSDPLPDEDADTASFHSADAVADSEHVPGGDEAVQKDKVCEEGTPKGGYTIEQYTAIMQVKLDQLAEQVGTLSDDELAMVLEQTFVSCGMFKKMYAVLMTEKIRRLPAETKEWAEGTIGEGAE